MFKLNILSGLYKFARHQKKTFSQLKQEESKNVIISELDDRCLISIEGKDAKKYLNIVTQGSSGNHNEWYWCDQQQ